METKQDNRSHENTTAPRSDFIKLNKIEPSRYPLSSEQDANTKQIKGSLNKKKLDLNQIYKVRNTGKILKQKRKPFRIKWRFKFMSKNETTCEKIKPLRSPLSDSQDANTESRMRIHETGMGSPNKKKLKFDDSNKTKNKKRLIKVKIKRLKIKQKCSGELLHKELKQEKLRKTLAQIKLGVVVVPENRAIIWKKRQDISTVKTYKKRAHKVKMWSILWDKSRVTFQGNAATKDLNKGGFLLYHQVNPYQN